MIEETDLELFLEDVYDTNSGLKVKIPKEVLDLWDIYKEHIFKKLLAKLGTKSKLSPSKKIKGMLTDGQGAYYPNDTNDKKGCGKEVDQDHGTPVYCGMTISGILHLCKSCQNKNYNLVSQERGKGEVGK